MAWDTVFGAGICAVGGLLIAWHLRSRRILMQYEVRPAELDFAHRQFRRRMQASAMMILVGVAILVAPLVAQQGLAYLIYWLAVLVVVLWMAALALADMLALQFHYARQRDRIYLERTRLAMQVTTAAKQRSSPSPTLSRSRPDRPESGPE